jgi:hypothetical protein
MVSLADRALLTDHTARLYHWQFLKVCRLASFMVCTSNRNYHFILFNNIKCNIVGRVELVAYEGNG